ncbi:relaxase/mobilization nuclease domain-containing protein [Pseudomonas syringae]|uniref:Relaxase/mobilization nuclease domain-containing protein n=6 Tax=Pseudomonas TaxID=286 RepID=A0A9Q4FGJ9_PSESX|nr:LPD7 domain-containing protein [Pseudomonas syringae]QED87705.1 relaxase [Pseudomonas amygdali pv. tabaci str. ATCC 11528]AQX41973.1 relaxase [Pseudomonas syringae pv. syringae]AQX42039.1 relaxase [Pseudomonas syringae pv. syringae]ATV21190.1 relaxase [Pseudomonas syringae pv. actinidiae]MCF5469551.1 relaxase/mobilization nuclease domain-containing protein [Pseudomonas syringae]
MLIRVSGYNTGAQEYLEQGNKSGREFTRDELDHRLIIEGQLSVTRAIYESIPDHGQDRYLTFTLSFKEDTVSPELLKAVTTEFKNFFMHAYKPEEFNLYAEAHLPKMKTVTNRKTGEVIDRKPHIHIIIPRINLLSGNEANPVDVYKNHEKYFEAFQEHINQKYGLSSPRENVRADITDAASVLSRYKGDDFYGKNRQFKQQLVKQVIERGVNSRADFYALVAEHGETRIRNEGKDNEYISVKLPGDAKGTNLKDTIFQDDFIVRRELRKPPLEASVIQERLLAWPQRAREIKYVNKATPKFRKQYSQASPEERVRLLAERETNFYRAHGDDYESVHTWQRQRDNQRSPAETTGRRTAAPADGLQDLSVSDVADHRQAGPTRSRDGALLLPSDAHVHVGQSQPGGDSGLRSSVPGGGRGRRAGSTAERGRGGSQPAAVSQETKGTATPAGATGRRRAGAGKSRNTRVRAGRVVPPYAQNPHRVATIADIEERGRRLFDPLKRPSDNALVFYRSSSHPQVADQLPQARAATTTPVQSTAGRRPRSSGKPRPPRQWRPGAVPPYAKNPHRVATVADIEQRARMLFDPLKRPADKALVFKRASIKALTVNKHASTVAAYFTRQAQHNQIAPAHRRAIRRIDQQYFALRRAVFSDQRLTRQDKAQLVSVLTFERLKAREQFHKPQPNIEVNLMGSAAIRNLLDDEKEDPGFSISGARGPGREGVRDQVKRIMDRFAKQVDPDAATERARDLSAKDLYTRKAKFSQNVHYLDKQTDKTLFVDTGTTISMRRTGITEAGVSVALQLARERFGSTLTINGTAEFKKLVIEAVAKNGLDVHFTDKAMNQSLADRRAELDIERDGQSIGPATDLPRHVDDATRDVRDQADRLGVTVPIEALYGQGKTADQVSQALTAQLDTVPESERIAFVETVAITLGIPERGQPKGDQAFAQWQAQRAQPAANSAASATSEAQANVPTPSDAVPEPVIPEAAKPALVNDPDLQSPSELVRLEAQWRRDFPMSEADVRASDTVMGLRGEDHAIWIIATDDKTPEAAALLTAYMENDSYREAFKASIVAAYKQVENSPQSVDDLDHLTAMAAQIVNEVEERLFPSPQAATGQTAPSRSKVIEGTLIDHGEAPYQHNDDNQMSYFVTLKPEGGKPRTVWGVGLEEAMSDADLKQGDQVRLRDLGTQPVVVQVIEEDGTVTDKTVNRREWSAQPVAPEREVAETTPKGQAAAAGTPELSSPDEDDGMSVD